MLNTITATNKDQGNLYSMGTINLGGTPTIANTKSNIDLTSFNQQMVQGNKTPTIVSNSTIKEQVPGIINKSESLGIQLKPANQPQPQVPQNTQQIKDYTNAPYSTREGQNYFYNDKTQAYDIPDVGPDTGLYEGNPYLLANAKRWEDSIKKNDLALASALEGIKNRFEQYRTTQKNLTESGAAGARNALLQSEGGSRGSVSQFAAATSDARVESIMKDGQQALQELDNKERELVSATQSAYATENFKYVSQLNDQIEKLRQEKLKTSTAMNEQIAQEAATARANQVQGERDNLIADIFSQGVTDPATILKETSKAGYNFTAKEINETLKNIASNLGTDTAGMSADLKEFYALKKMEGGLPVSILALPSVAEQAAAYVRLKTNAETKLKAGGGGVGTGVVSYGSPVLSTEKASQLRISPAAQNIVNLINAGSGTLDDYIKGTSISAQSLRNEVIAGVQATTGKSIKDIDGLLTAKDLAQEMLDEKDYRHFGYSALLGGTKTTGYGDMTTRAKQLNALLAKDNLGLLKGAMSDKDLAFIEAMSGGIGSDVTISEEYAKSRMEDIKKKIDAKIKTIDVESIKGIKPEVKTEGSGANDFLNTPLPTSQGYNPNVWGQVKTN